MSRTIVAALVGLGGVAICLLFATGSSSRNSTAPRPVAVSVPAATPQEMDPEARESTAFPLVAASLLRDEVVRVRLEAPGRSAQATAEQPAEPGSDGEASREEHLRSKAASSITMLFVGGPLSTSSLDLLAKDEYLNPRAHPLDDTLRQAILDKLEPLAKAFGEARRSFYDAETAVLAQLELERRFEKTGLPLANPTSQTPVSSMKEVRREWASDLSSVKTMVTDSSGERTFVITREEFPEVLGSMDIVRSTPTLAAEAVRALFAR